MSRQHRPLQAQGINPRSVFPDKSVNYKPHYTMHELKHMVKLKRERQGMFSRLNEMMSIMPKKKTNPNPYQISPTEQKKGGLFSHVASAFRNMFKRQKI